MDLLREIVWGLKGFVDFRVFGATGDIICDAALDTLPWRDIGFSGAGRFGQSVLEMFDPLQRVTHPRLDPILVPGNIRVGQIDQFVPRQYQNLVNEFVPGGHTSGILFQKHGNGVGDLDVKMGGNTENHLLFESTIQRPVDVNQKVLSEFIQKYKRSYPNNGIYKEGQRPGTWTHVEAQCAAYILCHENLHDGEFVLFINRLPCQECHRYLQRMLPVGTKLTVVYQYDGSNAIAFQYEGKEESGWITIARNYHLPWFIPINKDDFDTNWVQDEHWVFNPATFWQPWEWKNNQWQPPQV